MNRPFDKYKLYSDAVQSPQTDALFYEMTYKEVFGSVKSKMNLREDFCGAGAISCEWVKRNKNYFAFGLDLDIEPMMYGREKYVSKLKPDQKERIVLIQKNVLEKNLPSADISVAVNFSYFIFKNREILTKYFKNVFKSLNHRGLFLVDIFGGTNCTDAITDKTKLRQFTYYWDQKNFDPITNNAEFGIHFKYKNKMYKNVFSYDWRMWTIPEIKEMMFEAGFSDVLVYWEGTSSKGGGNGKFTPVKKGESCLSWIAYVVGIKN